MEGSRSCESCLRLWRDFLAEKPRSCLPLFWFGKSRLSFILSQGTRWTLALLRPRLKMASVATVLLQVCFHRTTDLWNSWKQSLRRWLLFHYKRKPPGLFSDQELWNCSSARRAKQKTNWGRRFLRNWFRFACLAVQCTQSFPSKKLHF